ncbi:hypothetical protein M5K25_013462 [Dendrobium thyrsiflorum]|uniref:Uncharacterized protein n=1 Tax=Dendrobium thyrsiflorum TaxID=117978 RepID=A0ABD0V0Y8_DENTH
MECFALVSLSLNLLPSRKRGSLGLPDLAGYLPLPAVPDSHVCRQIHGLLPVAFHRAALASYHRSPHRNRHRRAGEVSVGIVGRAQQTRSFYASASALLPFTKPG